MNKNEGPIGIYRIKNYDLGMGDCLEILNVLYEWQGWNERIGKKLNIMNVREWLIRIKNKKLKYNMWMDD